jgi:hypothetical protein
VRRRRGGDASAVGIGATAATGLEGGGVGSSTGSGTCGELGSASIRAATGSGSIAIATSRAVAFASASHRGATNVRTWGDASGLRISRLSANASARRSTVATAVTPDVSAPSASRPAVNAITSCCPGHAGSADHVRSGAATANQSVHRADIGFSTTLAQRAAARRLSRAGRRRRDHDSANIRSIGLRAASRSATGMSSSGVMSRRHT